MIIKREAWLKAGCDDNEPSTGSDIQNTWLQKFGENVKQIFGNKYVFKFHQWNWFLLISSYSAELIFI